MGVKYHVLKGEDINERHEFNDDASLIAFLDGNNEVEGEFLSSDFTGIKISYNTHTGVVHTAPISSSESQHVTIFYPAKSFHVIITPLENIIYLRNKRDFLLELYKFEILSISSIIKEHLDENGKFTRKLNLMDVDKTLLRIQQLANRIQFSLMSRYDNPEKQNVIYEILSRKAITDIKTKKEAEHIICMIKESLKKSTY